MISINIILEKTMAIAENRDTAPEMMSGIVLIHVPVTEFFLDYR
jgi:hypothetical protein